MLIMFFSWKRLSQWVCNIHIRMYLANLYVSLLDLFMDGIEASPDAFGSLVKSGFLCQGNCSSILQKIFIGPDALGITPRSDMNSFVQTPSFAASEVAMYSASHVDPALMLCLELHQLIAPPFNINMYDYKKRHIHDILGRTNFFPVILMTLL